MIDKNLLRQIKNQRPSEPVKEKKRLIYRLNKLFTFLFNLFHKRGFKYNSLNSKESLNLLLTTKKSLIRFGDGEARIIVGKDQGCQNYHPKLRKKLTEIWLNYSSDSPYLFALSNWNLTSSVEELKKRGTFHIWKFSRYLFWKFKMEKLKLPILETDMFRAGPAILDGKEIERLWNDYSNLIMVHHSLEYYKWFSSKYPEKKVFFIQIPDKNFFEFVEEKKEEVRELVKREKIDKKDIVILIAGGPGGKVFCYDLILEGFKCLDVGHYFHTFYNLEKMKNEKI